MFVLRPQEMGTVRRPGVSVVLQRQDISFARLISPVRKVKRLSRTAVRMQSKTRGVRISK